MSDVRPATLKSLNVELMFERSGFGVYEQHEILDAFVPTPKGDCFVQLVLTERHPHERDRAAATRGKGPTHLGIHFRTKEHPIGITLQIDAGEFLGIISRGYFAQRPEDTPILDVAPEAPGGSVKHRGGLWERKRR